MRHRCSPLAAFALLLVQPTAVGIAPCTAGRRFYTAFGWNSNCQLAPLSEPAKGKNLSALNFTCADGGLSNVVPLVHTRSLSPASVPCTVNPHGVRDGSCSPPAGPTDSTSEGGGWPNGTQLQPVGRRALHIKGADVALVWDWADNIAPLHGLQKHCAQPASAHRQWCPRSAQRNGVCPFPGIWWPHGTAALTAASTQYFRAFAAAGGVIDELVQDTEIGEDHWSSKITGDTSEQAMLCANLRWAAIEADPRWPQALSELEARGFAMGAGQTLAEAMNVSSLNRARSHGEVGGWTRNQAVLNQFVLELCTPTTIAGIRTAFPRRSSNDPANRGQDLGQGGRGAGARGLSTHIGF